METENATSSSPAEETGAVQTATTDVSQTKSKWARIRKIIMYGLLLVGLYLLGYYWFKTIRNKEKMQGQEGQAKAKSGGVGSFLGGILGFDKSGDPIMEKPVAESRGIPGVSSDDTEEAMYALAKRLKESGLRLQGVSQCIWTKHQREMFGGHQSKARQVLESIYTECRTKEMCPNIRGYPTWVHGDQQYPGFKSPAALRSFVREVEQRQPIPMLQGASEPSNENVPDARPAEPTGDEALTPEMAKKMMADWLKDYESKKRGNAVAEAESNRLGSSSGGGSGGLSKENQHAKQGGTSPLTKGGFPAGGGCDDDGNANGNATKKAVVKENVRGVSTYAPLNVPDMPGTEAFALEVEHHEHQLLQGNKPRVATDNSMPTPALMEQMIRTFDHARLQAATRNPSDQVYSRTRKPHSADITTGEAFDDKTIPVEKNQ